jgi:hypothetical protein
VALVTTDFSEERVASIIRVTRIGELGTNLAVTSNRSTLERNTNTKYMALSLMCLLLTQAFQITFCLLKLQFRNAQMNVIWSWSVQHETPSIKAVDL